MSQLGFATARSAVSARGDAYETRAGGLPTYFERALERPKCGCCGRPLFLVAQLFAPTNRDRALLVFGCNSMRCNALGEDSPALKTPGALWCVQRTQAARAYEVTPAPVLPPPKELAPGIPSPVAPTTVAVAPVADSWGAVGAWGDEPPPSPAAAATTAAPQPLLPSPSAAAAAAVSEPTTLSVAPPPSPHDTIRFPAFAISTFDEDDEGSDGGGDSDSDGSTDGGAGSGKLGDEAQRWRRYEEWRAAAGDDDAALEAPSAVDGDEGGEEEEEEEGEDDGGGAAAGGAAAGKATLGGWAGPGSDVVVTAAGPRSGWAGGAGSAAAGGRASRAQTGEPRRTRNAAPVARGRAHGGGGDEYEALPAETRYMLRWQAWLKRAGQPCIRYAYGLAPRWPVPPGDILVGGAGVPPCPCGRRRTFELQILPAVLSLLAVDEHVVETDEGVKEGGPLAPPQATASAASLTEATIAADSARRSAAAADVRGSGAGGPSRAAPRLLLGGGMDFSTVLVFSCPDSCAESSSEVAVVVPNR